MTKKKKKIPFEASRVFGLFPEARPDAQMPGDWQATCPVCNRKNALTVNSVDNDPDCYWGCYTDKIYKELKILEERYRAEVQEVDFGEENYDDDGGLPQSSLRSFTLAELRARPVQKRDLIVSPHMGRYESQFIYGPKGDGKTWVSLGCAIAGAQGNGARFLNFQADGPGVLTLFIDGEMFERDLRQRIEDICRTANLDPGENLLLWTPDMQPEGTPPLDLLTEAGRQMVLDHLDDVVQKVGRKVEQTYNDNLSTLLANWDENAASAFDPIAKWTLALRARRIGSTWVHHSNRQGGYRGSSAIVGAMHAIVKIQHPKNYRADMGAFFDVTFEYTRARPAADLVNFSAHLEGDVWTVSATATAAREADREEAILQILRDAGTVGISRKDLLAQLQKQSKGMKNATFLLLVKHLLNVRKVIESEGLFFDSRAWESRAGK